MNNLKEHTQLIAELSDYIEAEHLDVLDNPLLDVLIENPDISYWMASWLREKNATQLEHVLAHLPTMLLQMSPEAQQDALADFFQRAQLLRGLSPEPTIFDRALQPIPGSVATRIDGWSSLNRPLFAIAEMDILKLKKYAPFINHGIFTANTVLDMKPADCAKFDARVTGLIQDYANYMLPSKRNPKQLEPRIFEDELTEHIKTDKVINDLLAGINAFQPTIVAKKPVKNQSSAPLQTYNPISEEELAAFLGYDESETDTSDATDSEDVSHTKADSDTLTAWQRYNLDTNQLQTLIEIKQLNLHDIPDRALTEHEKALYLIMNTMVQDFGLDKASVSTDNDSHEESEVSGNTNLDRPLPPKGLLGSAQPVKPLGHLAAQHKPSTPKESTDSAPIIPDQRRPFRTDIKKGTHNKVYKKHLKAEHTISERVADYTRESKGAPRWHEEYKKRLQERTHRDFAERTDSETASRIKR